MQNPFQTREYKTAAQGKRTTITMNYSHQDSAPLQSFLQMQQQKAVELKNFNFVDSGGDSQSGRASFTGRHSTHKPPSVPQNIISMRSANTKIANESNAVTEFSNAKIQPSCGDSSKRKKDGFRDSILGPTYTKSGGTELKVVEKCTQPRSGVPLSPNLNHRIRSLNRAGSPKVPASIKPGFQAPQMNQKAAMKGLGAFRNNGVLNQKAKENGLQSK